MKLFCLEAVFKLHKFFVIQLFVVVGIKKYIYWGSVLSLLLEKHGISSSKSFCLCYLLLNKKLRIILSIQSGWIKAKIWCLQLSYSDRSTSHLSSWIKPITNLGNYSKLVTTSYCWWVWLSDASLSTTLFSSL